jgi:sarcosine oxidase delta subunit
MSFLLTCPNCGPRDVSEFRYGGEVVSPETPLANLPAVQREGWYHRLGCRLWFEAERDVRTNEVRRTAALEGDAS